MKELSQCCNKPKVANYSDEGTGAYLCQGCLGEFIPTTPIEEAIKRRESKMYHYYKSVFVDGFEGGYPAEYDDELLKIRREAIAEITKQIEKFAHKEMKDGNHAYEKLLILLKTFYI